MIKDRNMLIETQLFGTINKIEMAIARLKEFEPKEGYYLAFSGGKDSIVIYDLAKKADVKFDAHFAFTTVDPPEVIKFIKDEYPDVTIEKPLTTMWKLIVEKHIPPTRKIRYCCEHLKERGGENRFVITGVRWAESPKRKLRKLMEFCNKNNLNKKILRPIIDWENEDVWEYIHTNGLKYPILYDQGWKRIGCILCPMSTKRIKLMEIERYPKFKKAYILAFTKMLAKYTKVPKMGWKTGEDVFDWWIKNKKDIFNPNQITFME